MNYRQKGRGDVCCETIIKGAAIESVAIPAITCHYLPLPAITCHYLPLSRPEIICKRKSVPPDQLADTVIDATFSHDLFRLKKPLTIK